MKTDRELLELAAKAVGYELDGSRLDQPLVFNGYGEQETWNPLDDDGEALRLAALLHLWEAVRLAHRLASADIDIYAATRLAIVRAAAEIGENMK